MAFLCNFELWQTQGDGWLAHRSGQTQNNCFLIIFFFPLLPKPDELSQGGSERSAPPS